jgi:hypothetical protein
VKGKHKPATKPAKPKRCEAYAPRGTKCKLCGQVHPLRYGDRPAS